MKALQRFVAVGAVCTAVDVGLLVVLVTVLGLHPVTADVVAVATATVLSFLGHRLLTFPADPARRWYRNAGHYLAVASLALVVDVAVLALVTVGRSDVGLWWLAAGKAVSLGAAFCVRAAFFRREMFRAVRTDQAAPLARGPAPGDLRLSLVLPAYREAGAMAAVLQRIEDDLGFLRDEGGFEVIVVDDGSPDDTEAAARAAGADRAIRLEPNRGKGGAVRAGMAEARGRTVAFTDADLSYAPRQVLGLMEQIEEGGWDTVFGSRRHTDTRTLVTAGRLREAGGRIINVLTSVVLLGQYRDTQCGLKAFRSDVAGVLFGEGRIDGFAFDVELFHLIERYRFTLLEVPVEVVNSTRSTVRVVRDAGRLVRDLFRIRRHGRRGHYELDPADVPSTLLPGVGLPSDQAG